MWVEPLVGLICCRFGWMDLFRAGWVDAMLVGWGRGGYHAG